MNNKKQEVFPELKKYDMNIANLTETKATESEQQKALYRDGHSFEKNILRNIKRHCDYLNEKITHSKK